VFIGRWALAQFAVGGKDFTGFTKPVPENGDKRAQAAGRNGSPYRLRQLSGKPPDPYPVFGSGSREERLLYVLRRDLRKLVAVPGGGLWGQAGRYPLKSSIAGRAPFRVRLFIVVPHHHVGT
jgi:hypothetical protein